MPNSLGNAARGCKILYEIRVGDAKFPWKYGLGMPNSLGNTARGMPNSPGNSGVERFRVTQLSIHRRG